MTWSARLALPSFLISIFWYPLGELRRAPQRTEKHPKTNGQSQLHWITAHQRKPGKWTQRRIPSKTADLKVETECSWKTWLLIEASSTLACSELEARKEGSGKKKKKKVSHFHSLHHGPGVLPLHPHGSQLFLPTFTGQNRSVKDKRGEPTSLFATLLPGMRRLPIRKSILPREKAI